MRFLASVVLIVLTCNVCSGLETVLSGYLNEDGEIVVVSLGRQPGIQIFSETRNLVPLTGDPRPDPSPFAIVGSTDRQILYTALGGEPYLGGTFNTRVRLTDGDPSQLLGLCATITFSTEYRIFEEPPPRVTAKVEPDGSLSIFGDVAELTRVAVESESRQLFDARGNTVHWQKWFNDLDGLNGQLNFDVTSPLYPTSPEFDLVAIYCQEDGNCGEIEFITESNCNPNSSGDFDGDGRFDFGDFLILSFNFGKQVPDHTYGDLDCDGSVNFEDFLSMSLCFGCNSVGAEPVPEPDVSWGWTVIAWLCLFHPRRRTR